MLVNIWQERAEGLAQRQREHEEHEAGLRRKHAELQASLKVASVARGNLRTLSEPTVVVLRACSDIRTQGNWQKHTELRASLKESLRLTVTYQCCHHLLWQSLQIESVVRTHERRLCQSCKVGLDVRFSGLFPTALCLQVHTLCGCQQPIRH